MNAETLRQAIAAFNDRDAGQFAALCTQDVEIVPMRAAMEDTVYRGRDAVARFFADSDQTWEHLNLEVEMIHELGDTVVLVGPLRARGRTSGAEVEQRGGWIVQFDGGLIAAACTYSAAEDALAAAGLTD